MSVYACACFDVLAMDCSQVVTVIGVCEHREMLFVRKVFDSMLNYCIRFLLPET